MRLTLLRMLGALALPLAFGTTGLAAQQPPRGPSSPGYADASVALRLGTPGIGLELGKLLTSHVSVRVGANWLKITETKQQSDITYNATLKLQAVSALVDLYPARRGGFHFTAGIMTNPMKINGIGQPSAGGTYAINGVTYTAAQVGTLTAQGKFPGLSPYLGLGFGTPARRGGALEFLFDLGAAIGQPTISGNLTGAAANSTLASDFQKQIEKTQSDVRKYLKVYPVLSFGLAYRF